MQKFLLLSAQKMQKICYWSHKRCKSKRQLKLKFDIKKVSSLNVTFPSRPIFFIFTNFHFNLKAIKCCKMLASKKFAIKRNSRSCLLATIKLKSNINDKKRVFFFISTTFRVVTCNYTWNAHLSYVTIIESLISVVVIIIILIILSCQPWQ